MDLRAQVRAIEKRLKDIKDFPSYNFDDWTTEELKDFIFNYAETDKPLPQHIQDKKVWSVKHGS